MVVAEVCDQVQLQLLYVAVASADQILISLVITRDKPPDVRAVKTTVFGVLGANCAVIDRYRHNQC